MHRQSDQEARVVGANLLDLRVGLVMVVEDEPEAIVTRRLTYSGHFTVWWADDEVG